MSKHVKRGIALLSGGLDSTVAATLAVRYDMDIALSITFDYGQLSASQETSRAAAIAEFLGFSHRVISLPYFKSLTHPGNLLREGTPIPHPSHSALSDHALGLSNAREVWVPNRNGVFIELAAMVAEDQNAQAIVVGFNKEEADAFPDNSVDYLIAITHALSFSTSNKVEVYSPTASFTKAQIVEHAKQENIPFSLLWSCYENGPKMCGLCESCMRLKRGLHANHLSAEELFEHVSL